MSDFDWSNSGSIVLRAYDSLAVHKNPCGDVVVRQERHALEEDDSWVVIPVQDAEYIALVIIAKAQEIKAGANGDEQRQPEPPLALPGPAPAKLASHQQKLILPRGQRA
jgi:hypothetical protein